MSIIWEGMQAQPTFSRPSSAFRGVLYYGASLGSPNRQERKHTVRNVGMHTGCAVAGHPIIPFSCHRCQAPVAKTLALSQPFLSWYPFYATLRPCLRQPSYDTYEVSPGEGTRAITSHAVDARNGKVGVLHSHKPTSSQPTQRKISR